MEGAARQFKELMLLLYRLSHPPVVQKNVFIAVWYFYFFASPVSNFGSYVSLRVTAEGAGGAFDTLVCFCLRFFFLVGRWMRLTRIKMPSCEGKWRDVTDVVFVPDNAGVEMGAVLKSTFSRESKEVTEVFRGVKTIIKRLAQTGSKRKLSSLVAAATGDSAKLWVKPNLFHFILKLRVSRHVSALPAFVVASNGPPPTD